MLVFPIIHTALPALIRVGAAQKLCRCWSLRDYELQTTSNVLIIVLSTRRSSSHTTRCLL